jgi:methylmalonyl-CoA/ethylmalonyl-CoA epimerase
MIKRLHHVAIVVDDFDEAKRFVGDVLGLQLTREVDVPQRRRRTAWYRCGEVDIEVIDDLDATSKARALDGAGARIEHIALEVADVQAALTALGNKGVRVGEGGIVRIGTRLNAWTEPETSDGVMYQILAEAPQSGKPLA